MAQLLKFAEKMEILRKAKGMTMSEAERRCGFSEGRWERMIYRGNTPLADDFLKFMKAFDVSADAFEPEDFQEKV